MAERDLLVPLPGIRRHGPAALRLMILGLVSVFLVSCASSPALMTMPLPPVSPEPAVVLAPGDVIDVKFRYWPELDESQTVRPDGMISLQLLDEIRAAGLTPKQLDQQLTELYTPKIKQPVLTVIVRSLVNQLVYVGGEVNAPGMIPLNGRLTALEALIAAGGFDKASAATSNVVVIRHVDDKRYATALDMRVPLNSPESDPFYLAPKDIVYVPRTKIDRLNQWVDQYISKVIPSTVLNLSRTVGHTTYGYGTR